MGSFRTRKSAQTYTIFRQVQGDFGVDRAKGPHDERGGETRRGEGRRRERTCIFTRAVSRGLVKVAAMAGPHPEMIKFSTACSGGRSTAGRGGPRFSPMRRMHARAGCQGVRY